MKRIPLALLLATLLFVGACSAGPDEVIPTAGGPSPSPSKGEGKTGGRDAKPSPEAPGDASGIDNLDHLVFIVMENRSFDHYFGTYPGADGIPKNACVPHPGQGGKCMKPYHDTDTFDIGGPHTKPASDITINKGKMDGFIEAALKQPDNVCLQNPRFASCKDRLGPQGQPEILGYHTRAEIPVYWEIADHGVLQDRMFAPTDSWTLPAHLYLVSAWSALCKSQTKPMSCQTSIGGYGEKLDVPKNANDTPYAWTDITYLLHEHDVSWGFYISPKGTCYEKTCDMKRNEDQTTGFQNVLPGFTSVKETGQRKNIRPYTEYVENAEAGDLPSVSWVMPAIGESEHPGHSDLKAGQRFVSEMVNAVTEGPSWDDTAIFVVWDDWGGFYDHVKPPRIDQGGYGIRVPGLMLSPYAKEGMIDHQILTFDAYLKLIEDRFLKSERLDPETLSRPDSRPTVREEVRQLGDLAKEFDFDQDPREPIVLVPPK